ncbi:MAG: SCO family protein [Sulfuricurvum sp.]|jgi:protein SCO1/2|uniref:SCO family protein n=1 Tax=Sulfuricurvum sp. TaxID=2025608 RepID=UPI0025FED0DB|nr:SCO family protein [Sulfuricurvum sp.]MCK9373681.1 SCO family protein [Sulfuricurvum sp.]
MKKTIKTLSGVVLIVMGFGLIVALAFPSLSDSAHAGRSEKKIPLEFSFLKEEHAPLVLIYFGYVGCTRVCTPALSDLAQIYRLRKIASADHLPALWFVNMTPRMDSASVQSWAEHFDSDFKSYAPSESELQTISQTLNLVYTNLGVKAEHMPYAYLAKKTDIGYELVYIYTSSPYNRTVMLQDMEALQ